MTARRERSPQPILPGFGETKEPRKTTEWTLVPGTIKWSGPRIEYRMILGVVQTETIVTPLVPRPTVDNRVASFNVLVLPKDSDPSEERETFWVAKRRGASGFERVQDLTSQVL